MTGNHSRGGAGVLGSREDAKTPRADANGYASLTQLASFAAAVMCTPPDLVIGPTDDPYLLRWFVIPRNEFSNVYLHKILRSDDDRALHDHPWASRSFIIEGGYFEHLADGSREWRGAGWVGERQAKDAHRLEIIEGDYAITLFFTGPKEREWGFHCPNEWRHHTDFTTGVKGELIGRGCGE